MKTKVEYVRSGYKPLRASLVPPAPRRPRKGLSVSRADAKVQQCQVIARKVDEALGNCRKAFAAIDMVKQQKAAIRKRNELEQKLAEQAEQRRLMAIVARLQNKVSSLNAQILERESE